MNDTISSVQKALSHTVVTVGAPVTGGGIGIISLLENMVPLLTVISLITGLVLGCLSYRLKRRLYKKQLEQLEKE